MSTEWDPYPTSDEGPMKCGNCSAYNTCTMWLIRNISNAGCGFWKPIPVATTDAPDEGKMRSMTPDESKSYHAGIASMATKTGVFLNALEPKDGIHVNGLNRSWTSDSEVTYLRESIAKRDDLIRWMSDWLVDMSKEFTQNANELLGDVTNK